MSADGQLDNRGAKRLPSARLLNRILRYDACTGRLYWRSRPRWMFKSSAAHSLFATSFDGAEALTAVVDCATPHRSGIIFGRAYKAHRIVWKMIHGSDPGIVDHINGDATDNRIANLRVVTSAGNMKNLTRRKDNTSGHTGIVWLPKKQRWCAQVRVDGKSYCRLRPTLQEAVEVRDALWRTHGVTHRGDLKIGGANG
jgi:hypothetical protein